jgi:hypothetical protein
VPTLGNVLVPTLDNVLVPTLDIVLVPTLDIVLVPNLDIILVPTLAIVLVPTHGHDIVLDYLLTTTSTQSHLPVLGAVILRETPELLFSCKRGVALLILVSNKLECGELVVACYPPGAKSNYKRHLDSYVTARQILPGY